MTNAYVKVGIDLNHIESISTSISVEHTVEVVLDNDFVDFSKINGYVGYVADDGLTHLKFDEERYNEYINEKLKRDAIEKGEQLKQELVVNVVLTTASDEDAYTMRYLYPNWSGDGVKYAVGDRMMYNDKLYKALEEHVSQGDCTPDTDDSLYKEIVFE